MTMTFKVKENPHYQVVLFTCMLAVAEHTEWNSFKGKYANSKPV